VPCQLTPWGRAEADRLLADYRVKLLRKLGEKVEANEGSDKVLALGEEESAAMLVSVALPAERQRIRNLLALIPSGHESKTQELLQAFGDLWGIHPGEKIVVFTTYLGSVDALKTAIEVSFPGAGVEVLKGGDHGAKVAAERRFKKQDGPRVLICTAAGREGINLQFARVLFNHDLPWNPMDLEQRIGRIHRYGQAHTAQVYNVLSTDTIEGQIFLLLEEKLLQIARTLGKVDERGQIAEDLRTQILGQLSERISYDKLYQEAVRDPRLVRTRQELDVAIENAQTARRVVFELFQDLEGFRLDDYRVMDDAGAGMKRLVNYMQTSLLQHGGTYRKIGENIYEISGATDTTRLTTEREVAKADEALALLGLEHPLIRGLSERDIALPARSRGIMATLGTQTSGPCVLPIWKVLLRNPDGMGISLIIPLAADRLGNRRADCESTASNIRVLSEASTAGLSPKEREMLLGSFFPEMLQRDLAFKGHLSDGASISSRLLAWVELSSDSRS
jgi:hypothetical protein